MLVKTRKNEVILISILTRVIAEFVTSRLMGTASSTQLLNNNILGQIIATFNL